MGGIPVGRYVLKRILIAVPVLLLITVINFAFIHISPGDPVMMMLPPDVIQSGGAPSAEVLAQMRERLGLDQPIYVQYFRWLGEMLQGNLGTSLGSRKAVAPLLAARILPTIKLMALSLTISLVVGIGVGVVSAVRQYSLIDYLSTFASFVAVSVPNFFLALIAVYIFALKLKWLPTSGTQTIGGNGGFLDTMKYITLPALVLGLSSAASLVRYTRSSLLEVMRMDYVTTARSKGLANRVVIFKHAFRNSLLPVITVVSLSLPNLFGGSVVIESVFNYSGMGSFAVEGVFAKDYPVIMAVNIVSSALVLCANLLADVAYAAVDPRIRYR